MEHSHAAYALLRLHAEIAGEVVKHKNKQRRLRRDMEKVRAVIRMLEPKIGRIPTKAIVRRKPNPWFKHGTLYPAAVAIIKAAGRPLHAMEITWALFQPAWHRAQRLGVRLRAAAFRRTVAYLQPGPQHRGRRNAPGALEIGRLAKFSPIAFGAKSRASRRR
jgi:hypothetical protein